MTQADEEQWGEYQPAGLARIAWTWVNWPWVRRWAVLATVLAIVIYLNAGDVGPRVAVPYFAAVAGILPVLLLAVFIHARDIAAGSAERLAVHQRLVDDMRRDVDESMFRFASLSFAQTTQVPKNWLEKMESLDALRDRIDEADEGLQGEDEQRVEEFGERWATLLVCIVEVAAVGEVAALVALTASTPVLPPALLSGAAVAAVLVLVTWAVVLLIWFSTQPVTGSGGDGESQ